MFQGCTHRSPSIAWFFQWSDSSLDNSLVCMCETVGGGHSGLGRCRPSMSGVSCGLWVALVGVQSPREAWAALR